RQDYRIILGKGAKLLQKIPGTPEMNFFAPQSVYYYRRVMDLIEQWQAGKADAFEAIFHRYQG
ncbi:hypothetical protein M1O12_04800, partial [Dehalococcoidia bacterium]|nr:hypothetical protein [Dehalococcoidia bacterium]